MAVEAVLISRADVDFTTLLGVATQVFGFSPGAAADNSPMKLSPEFRFLSCLASLRDAKGTVELNPRFFQHASASIFLVAGDLDMMDILECAAGMAFVTAETILRGVHAAVITGTLAQWRVAVMAGSSTDVTVSVRAAYNKIHGLFCDGDLNLWPDCRQKQAPDARTYLIEDKRGR